MSYTIRSLSQYFLFTGDFELGSFYPTSLIKCITFDGSELLFVRSDIKEIVHTNELAMVTAVAVRAVTQWQDTGEMTHVWVHR